MVKKSKQKIIKFDKSIIPIMLLNTNGNEKENWVSIEVKDFAHRKILGSYKGPIAQLLIPGDYSCKYGI